VYCLNYGEGKLGHLARVCEDLIVALHLHAQGTRQTDLFLLLFFLRQTYVYNSFSAVQTKSTRAVKPK